MRWVVKRGRYQYVLPLWGTAVVVALVIFNLWFSVWEIQRYHWKRGLMARLEQRQAMPSLSLSEWSMSPHRAYRRLRVTQGHLDDHPWMWRGRFHQGQPGYHAMGIWVGPDGMRYAVDGGWYAHPKTLAKLPLHAEVMAWPLPQPNAIEQWMMTRHAPIKHQAPRINPTQHKLQQWLGKPVSPYYWKVIDTPGLVQTHWHPSVSPMRHLGYAFEFFFFACLGGWGYVRLQRRLICQNG